MRNGSKQLSNVFVLPVMLVLMVLVGLVLQHLFQMLTKQVVFVTHHPKFSLWIEDFVRNVLPTHLLMQAKPVVTVTKDTEKKMEVVSWISALKIQPGTKEDLNVSVTFKENILLVEDVELVRRMKSGMEKDVFVIKISTKSLESAELATLIPSTMDQIVNVTMATMETEISVNLVTHLVEPAVVLKLTNV